MKSHHRLARQGCIQLSWGIWRSWCSCIHLTSPCTGPSHRTACTRGCKCCRWHIWTRWLNNYCRPWCTAGLATNSIFFCFLFVKNPPESPPGKSMTPHRGNTIIFRSSSNSHVSVLNPWRDFLADTVPFKGPQPRRVLCFRKYRDTRTQSCVSR